MRRQVEQVRKFLYGWLVEGAPDMVASLYEYAFSTSPRRGQRAAWECLEGVERYVEDWAIDIGVSTTPVDDAHPDAPWGDNLVRKLMVIRGHVAPQGGRFEI